MDADHIDWNEEKNAELKARHKVSFSDVVQAIEDGDVLYVGPHHNPARYPHQYVLIVAISEYAYIVPFVLDGERNCFFLKTIYPSRVATARFITNT